MITVAFSTRKIDPSFVELLKKTSGIKSLEVLPFENNGEYSLTQVYNMALEKSSNDIVVLCHDDLYFDSNNWGQKVLNHFKTHPPKGEFVVVLEGVNAKEGDDLLALNDD